VQLTQSASDWHSRGYSSFLAAGRSLRARLSPPHSPPSLVVEHAIIDGKFPATLSSLALTADCFWLGRCWCDRDVCRRAAQAPAQYDSWLSACCHRLHQFCPWCRRNHTGRRDGRAQAV